MKILHLEATNYSESALNALRNIGVLEIKEPQSKEELDMILMQSNYDCIFTTIGNTLDRVNLAFQKNLKYIVSPTTGLNHIDIDYAIEKKIEVISLKGESEFLSSIQSTAEHTWMLVLSLLRNFKKVQQSISNGIWSRNELLCDELNTRTIGIIGYGRLGKIIAQYAQAFSMKILVCETDSKNQILAIQNGFEIYSKEEIFSMSDVIVLLTDYTKENEKMIGKNEFFKMKKSAFFVNTSRGEMVDEGALLYALENKLIKAAALDVLNGDSDWKTNLPSNHKLYEYSQVNSNLIITPHIGGYGKVSIQKTRDFITNKFLKNIKK
jgi:D-3-phosphoglycerate dehydrogenase